MDSVKSFCQGLNDRDSSRVLKVFLSSTFRDFQKERDYLRDRVFPDIRREARTRGIELIVIDLRTGLTDDESKLGGAVVVCLEEVERSRPHFIALIGERYGWIPKSGNLPDLSRLEAKRAHQLLKWFQAEESMTAMEIRHGVLENEGERRYSWFYLRDRILTEKFAKESGEDTNFFCGEPKTAPKLKSLKNEIREGAKSGGWHVRGYDNFDSLGHQVAADLRWALEERFPIDEIPDIRSMADAPHESYARDRLKSYFPNKVFLNSLLTCLNKKEPVFISGLSGQGKSAILSCLSREFCRQHPEAFVFVHYVGVAGENSLEAILERLRYSLGMEDRFREEDLQRNLPSKSPEDLLLEIGETLSSVAKERPCLLAIDALDQIRNGKLDLTKLRFLRVPGVSLLLSARIRPANLVMDVEEFLIPELDPQQIRQIITHSLAPYRKDLTDNQKRLIEESPHTRNPLYLRILLDELIAFGKLKKEDEDSQDQFMDEMIANYLACSDVPALYTKLFERLEEAFSFETIQRFFLPLKLTRLGMASGELAEIAGISGIDSAVLRSNLDYHLMEDNGLLRPFHRALGDAIEIRYEKSPEVRTMQENLRQYFEKQDSTGKQRQYEELPWLYVALEKRETLGTFLCKREIADYYTKQKFGIRAQNYMELWNSTHKSESKIAKLYLRECSENPQDTIILNEVGLFMISMGKFAIAEFLFRNFFKIRGQSLDSEDPRIFTLRLNLAVAISGQGRYHEAEKLFKKVLDIQTRNLGSENSNTLSTIHSLGITLGQQGNYPEAERLFKKVLDIQTRILGPENPNTLSTINSLAMALDHQNKKREAELLLRKVLEIQTRVLGPEHPSSTTTQNNLASVLMGQRNYIEAEVLVRKALESSTKNLGSEHPNTLGIQNNLATLCMDQKNYAEAELLHRKALNICTQALGLRNPDTLKSLSNLATVLMKQEKYLEAESLFKKALEIQRKDLGSEHPDTIRTLYTLALVLFGKKNYSEAESLFKKALETQRKALGSEHPDTIRTLYTLALILLGKKNYMEAEVLLRKVLESWTRVFGPEHPDRITSLNSLAILLQEQGKYNEAEYLFRELMEIQIRVLGPEHPDTLVSLISLAMLLDHQGKNGEAELLRRKVLEIQTRVLGPEHLNT